MVAPSSVVKRARGFLRSFQLQKVRGVSLSFCTTKIGQKNETTKSKPLFSNILAIFFRPPRIFFDDRKITLRGRGGGDFCGREGPLHTTPRSLFFARVLKVAWGLLWEYFSWGIKWCQNSLFCMVLYRLHGKI